MWGGVAWVGSSTALSIRLPRRRHLLFRLVAPESESRDWFVDYHLHESSRGEEVVDGGRFAEHTQHTRARHTHRGENIYPQ